MFNYISQPKSCFSPPWLLPNLAKAQLTARHNQLLTSNPSHLGYLWTCPKAAGWKPQTPLWKTGICLRRISASMSQISKKKLRPVSWDAAHAKHFIMFPILIWKMIQNFRTKHPGLPGVQRPHARRAKPSEQKVLSWMLLNSSTLFNVTIIASNPSNWTSEYLKTPKNLERKLKEMKWRRGIKASKHSSTAIQVVVSHANPKSYMFFCKTAAWNITHATVLPQAPVSHLKGWKAHASPWRN